MCRSIVHPRKHAGILKLVTSICRTLLSLTAAASAVVPVFAEVTTSEFLSDPQSEGWQLAGQQGDVTTWVANGIFLQNLSHSCPMGPVCDLQAFTRTAQSYVGRLRWFYEYRCSATGSHTEIPAAAPTVFSAFNAFGNLYHATLASDQIKLSGDADLPILFLDISEGVPHTIRLELDNNAPASFRWHVDSVVVLEGFADSPFPDFDARITWQGETWMQPTLNAWYYIRFGDIPVDSSGDFDSDGEVDDFDLFYFDECLSRCAAGEPAMPSCTWGDFNADNTVDCADWDAFRAAWTGPDDPMTPPACVASVPGVSANGIVVLGVLLIAAGELVFRAHRLRVPAVRGSRGRMSRGGGASLLSDVNHPYC